VPVRKLTLGPRTGLGPEGAVELASIRAAALCTGQMWCTKPGSAAELQQQLAAS